MARSSDESVHSHKWSNTSAELHRWSGTESYGSWANSHQLNLRRKRFESRMTPADLMNLYRFQRLQGVRVVKVCSYTNSSQEEINSIQILAICRLQERLKTWWAAHPLALFGLRDPFTLMVANWRRPPASELGGAGAEGLNTVNQVSGAHHQVE